MCPIEIKSRVGADGVLHICLPLGIDEANREVKVSVEPADTPASSVSHKEWREFVDNMAGYISDATFQRPDQGEYEKNP